MATHVSRDLAIRVAKMRREDGATWKEVIEATGLSKSSTRWRIDVLEPYGFDSDGLKLDGTGPRESKAVSRPHEKLTFAEKDPPSTANYLVKGEVRLDDKYEHPLSRVEIVFAEGNRLRIRIPGGNPIVIEGAYLEGAGKGTVLKLRAE